MNKTFKLEIPRPFSENSFELFFTLLNNSIINIENTDKKVHRKIIIAYFAHTNVALLNQIAQKYGFEVFDFEKLLSVKDKDNGGDLQTRIPVDGHPTSEAYWLLSQALKFRYF